MIKRLTVRNFKRFREETFELADSVVLAGPNNAGKSTLLQAVATWKFALDRWVRQRRGSQGSQRSGIPIARADFTAAPLREMNLLWENRRVTDNDGEAISQRLIDIVVEGGEREAAWTCGLEFQYANPEMIYVRPQRAKELSREAILAFPPPAARALEVVYVPPLSGIERDEPRRERGLQDLLVGQGRPGQILRNLLWEIAQNDPAQWAAFGEQVRELFRIELREPRYSPADPYIVCEYREQGQARALDLSNAGSGTLQVLLLLAFLYARSAAVMLLDEPDAHQHIILQKQVYERMRKAARERGAQLILATHSEALLNATEPMQVFGFLGGQPRALADAADRERLRDGLRQVSTTDLLLAREIGAVLYVDAESDARILGEWARILGHPAQRFFERPFVQALKGGGLNEGSRHFRALQAAAPGLRAVCLLDGGDPDQAATGTESSDLAVASWRRRAIENYLLQPKAIERYLDAPLFQARIGDSFWSRVPRDADLFGGHPSLADVAASEDFIEPLLREFGSATPIQDFYLLAAAMRPDEIHPEVREKLDRIAEWLNPSDADGQEPTAGPDR